MPDEGIIRCGQVVASFFSLSRSRGYSYCLGSREFQIYVLKLYASIEPIRNLRKTLKNKWKYLKAYIQAR